MVHLSSALAAPPSIDEHAFAPIVSQSTRNDISPLLRSITPIEPVAGEEIREIPNFPLAKRVGNDAPSRSNTVTQGESSKQGMRPSNAPLSGSSTIYLPLAVKNFGPPTLLANGDFESGPIIWTEYSKQNYLLILDNLNLPVPPYSGNWAAWLGGANNETSYIEQTVTVPTNQPYLSYWHWIISDESCGTDFGAVFVNVILADQYNLCTSEETGSWQKHVVDLSAYAGQNVALVIWASTGPTHESSLFVDDVAFQSVPLRPSERSPQEHRQGGRLDGRKPEELIWPRR